MGNGRTIRWKSSLILTGALLLAFPSFWMTHSLRFVEETVIFNVYPDRLDVSGDYLFENASRLPAIQLIRYPFPVDDTHPCPDAIRAAWEDAADRRLIAPVVANSAFLYVLMPPHSKRTLHIDYTQHCGGNMAEYILTTTRTWGEPLRKARFQLLPHDIGSIMCNYPELTNVGSSGMVEYHSFFPGVNLCLSWEAI